MSSLDGIRKQVKRANREHLSRVVSEAVDDQKSESPVDQGDLKASHRSEKISDLSYNVGPDATLLELSRGTDYAPFVYYGTRPHLISVKNANVLTDGNTFFGKVVKHPGTKANKWLDRATKKTRAKIQELYRV